VVGRLGLGEFGLLLPVRDLVSGMTEEQVLGGSRLGGLRCPS
jgi:hypothetical protein